MDVTEWMFSDWLYEPGVYRLTVEAEGYRKLTHEVRLVASVVTRLELEMERAP